MQININNELSLTETRPTDVPALVKHLNDETIHRNTLTIPYPYRDSDAKEWLGKNQQSWEQHGNHLNLAIRKIEELIGVIGLIEIGPPQPHRSEVGYWLARQERGHGIASQALQHFVPYAFDTFGLEKLTAFVFAGNRASERVLLKSGFQLEGRFRGHIKKDGRLVDLTGFGLLRDEYQLPAQDHDSSS